MKINFERVLLIQSKAYIYNMNFSFLNSLSGEKVINESIDTKDKLCYCQEWSVLILLLLVIFYFEWFWKCTGTSKLLLIILWTRNAKCGIIDVNKLVMVITLYVLLTLACVGGAEGYCNCFVCLSVYLLAYF